MLALTERDAIRQAFDAFSERLRPGAQEFQRIVGHQGDSYPKTIYWRPQEGFWFFLEPIENRYWCCFGLEDPSGQNNLSSTCQINPPLEGVNRRCAGVFLADDSGRVYIAHTGKVGGGRRGIGKEAFERLYRGNWDTITWPGKPPCPARRPRTWLQTRAVIIGAVDGENLPAQIRDFVIEVRRIKQEAVA